MTSQVVGIRPEHVPPAPVEGATFAPPFNVELIEPAGSDSLHRAQAGPAARYGLKVS